jgi:hypothetical protein
VETNSTGGQGSRRAVAPSDDDDDLFLSSYACNRKVLCANDSSELNMDLSVTC